MEAEPVDGVATRLVGARGIGFINTEGDGADGGDVPVTIILPGDEVTV